MPRQPYLPAFQNLNYAIGASTVRSRNDLMAHVGRCVALWSHVDEQVGVLFGVLMGAGTVVALEVFLTLRASGKQVEALQAAAQQHLNAEESKVFGALLSRYRRLEKERNALAHGVFGIFEQDSSLLCWIEQKHHVQFITAVLPALTKGIAGSEPHKMLKEHLFVYRDTDLAQIYEEMDEFYWAIFNLNCYLRDSTSAAGATCYGKLKALSWIDAALVINGQ